MFRSDELRCPAFVGATGWLRTALPALAPALALASALALALSLTFASALPLLADPPDFDGAVATWLHGDEAEALGELSILARSGDNRARLLLGLIDKSPQLQGPWLSRLPRDQRMALMRAPGGLSGRSWLTLAAELPVARAWLQMLQVGAGLETAAELAALGEARAARQAVTMIAAREQLDMGDSWPDWLDPELAWLVWPSAGAELREAIAAMIPETHPQRAMMGLSTVEGALGPWLAENPAAAPLRAICQSECPDSMVSCLAAAYAALNSHAAVLTLGSPTATLIPDPEFLVSLRGRRAGLRRMLMATSVRGRAGLIERAGNTDACLGALLAAENVRYRYVREGAPAIENDGD